MREMSNQGNSHLYIKTHQTHNLQNDFNLRYSKRHKYNMGTKNLKQRYICLV